VADFHEAPRQHVQQEAADEALRGQRGVATVAGAEADRLVVDGDETGIADGDAVGVAAEVGVMRSSP